MRGVCVSPYVLAAVVFGVMAMLASPADARCYTFEQSHNGTDLFNPGGGARIAATKKLMYSVDMWKRQKGIRKVRIGKVKTRCEPWTMKYVLPHHRCYARARVCY